MVLRSGREWKAMIDVGPSKKTDRACSSKALIPAEAFNRPVASDSTGRNDRRTK
jgi:hypothetical protein